MNTYKYINGNWMKNGMYKNTNITNLPGLESIYHDILADIDINSKRADLLSSLDMNPSLNYLITSKAGMGKTSLIRAICTAIKTDIHIIDHDAMNTGRIENIFNVDTTVFLFEDLDRYLMNAKKEHITNLLNILDGVEIMPMSIRIFTSSERIQEETFLTHMRRCIVLNTHSVEAYKRSISLIFPHMYDDDIDNLVDIFSSNNISIRVVNQLLCSALVHNDPIKYIENTLE